MENKALDLCRKLVDSGQLQKAEKACEKLLLARPRDPDAWVVLAALRTHQGQPAKAMEHAEHALTLKPGHVPALERLTELLLTEQRFEDAARAMEQLCEKRPSDVRARINLCDALYHAGNARARLHDVQGAERLYRRALAIRPDSPAVLMNLGAMAMRRGSLREAEAIFRDALARSPSDARLMGFLADALSRLGEVEEASELLEKALAIDPRDRQVHYSRALLRLSLGRFEEGFAEYELRPHLVAHRFRQPRWDSGELAGKTILLHSEQGLGDTLQFVRYAALAKERGGRVIVLCQPPLQSLLAQCPFIDSVVAEGEPLPPFDLQAPLMSMPAIAGTRGATIPREIPYLFAPAANIAKFAEDRRMPPGLHVGMCWRGSSGNSNDALRSFPAAALRPLLDVPGVHGYVLQKRDGVSGLDEGSESLGLHDWAQRLSSFLDTAAAVRALDLVVTCDTAVAHLAGGLGQRVWLALPSAVEWRWQRAGAETPWYPTMRLFRQEKDGDWAGVFRRMAAELARAQKEGWS